MTENKAPVSGAFKLRLYSGEGWFVQDGSGKDVAGSYSEQKTAARKARQLSAGEPAAKPEEPKPAEGGGEASGDGREASKTPAAEPKAKRQPKAKPAETPAEPKAEPEAADWSALASDGGIQGGSKERHEWLELARVECERLLSMVDNFTLPSKVRVSVGMPFGTRKAIGQCWHEEASSDGFREVFVSPTLCDGPRICDVLLHELVHASLPSKVKHGPAFKRVALAVGLTGKMTATVAGESLAEHFEAFVKQIGPYPAGSIDPNNAGRKKQTTRLLKAECHGCGYTIRLTAKWANKGLPLCGNQECTYYGEAESLTCEGFGEGDAGDEGEED